MILTIFIGLAYIPMAILLLPFPLYPEGTRALPEGFLTAVETMAGKLSIFNYVFPVSELYTLLVLAVIIQIAFLTMELFLLIASFIPFIRGSR